MNTARLIWGILSLTAAGVLVVITLVLPPDKTLQLGDSAVPWLPAAGSGLPDGWVAAGTPDRVGQRWAKQTGVQSSPLLTCATTGPVV